MSLPAVVAEHIRAVNAFDTPALLDTFAEDAVVNDNRREIVGRNAILAWLSKEIVGERVTMQPRRVREHYGDVIVDAEYQGDFDKTNLPSPLILTNYFGLRGEKIVSLTILLNQPNSYGS